MGATSHAAATRTAVKQQAGGSGIPRNPDITLPIGVVIRQSPGVTRWAKYAWKAVAVIPGAGPADWKLLRREGEVADYHAATLTLPLWRTDTEAYRQALTAEPPTIYVVLRRDDAHVSGLSVAFVTASAYEAQDYCDGSEDIVEAVPMPAGLVALVRDFVEVHHVEEVFVKRRRDRVCVDLDEAGIGDPRIRQAADIYRAPLSPRKGARA